jgi:hypothetical protein
LALENYAAWHGPFVPFLLLLIGFLAWMALQMTQLVADRRNLSSAVAQQTAALETAQRIRTATDSLAVKTQALADLGNPNASAVVTELRRRGITINTYSPPAVPPP